MKSLFVYVSLVCFFIFPGQQVLAWDDVGHKLTTFIAWERLTPQTRERIAAILKAAPEDSDLGMLYPQDSRSDEAKRRDHFVIASTWSDIVRDRSYDVRFKKYHKGTWHYYDSFWTVENGSVKILEMPKEDGGQAVPKLFEFEKVLQSESASDAEKSIALAWILHLIGDLHQPLHCSARVTPEEPKGDQGGNLFLLRPKDTPREKQENLHWLWDSIVKRTVLRVNDEPDQLYIPKIARQIVKKHPYSRIAARIKPGKYYDWHKEGLQLAIDEVFPASLKRFEEPSKSYQNSAFKISEEQIALAGFRIAELLNRVLGEKKPVAANSEVPCKIIRRVHYPITKTDPSSQPLEIALLNLCPANKGMVARPMYSFFIDGKMTMHEYDVERIFATDAEARDYAAKNGIKDISF